MTKPEAYKQSSGPISGPFFPPTSTLSVPLSPKWPSRQLCSCSCSASLGRGEGGRYRPAGPAEAAACRAELGSTRMSNARGRSLRAATKASRNRIIFGCHVAGPRLFSAFFKVCASSMCRQPAPGAVRAVAGVEIGRSKAARWRDRNACGGRGLSGHAAQTTTTRRRPKNNSENQGCVDASTVVRPQNSFWVLSPTTLSGYPL